MTSTTMTTLADLAGSEEQLVQFEKGYFCCVIEALLGIEAVQLYVDWQVEISPGWILDSKSTPFTSGSTQRSVPTWDSSMQKYRCSFGLMINLNFDRISLDSRDIMPKLHFHVRSIDNYQRFCSEGYGSTYLPDISGHDSKTVSLWTIMPSNDTGRMRRFFLGNAPELACPAFDGNLTNSIVNKYGQNTEPSGYLVLQFEMIWERCQERALSRYSSATGRKSSGLFQQVYDNYAHNQII